MKLKVGLVGAGYIAQELHLPVLKNLGNVELTALCDQNTSAAKEVASRFRIKNVFYDFADMLKNEKLDVVDICTPPKTHSFLSIQAMKAGCHVLVEKPMAVSVEEADRMVDSSRKHNAKLCVIHQNLCNPAVIKTKRIVEDGDIGELLTVDAQIFERKDSEMVSNRNHWSHALPGGIFNEILPHPIYLLQSFLKEAKPIHVYAKKLGNAEWMTKDELMVTVEAKNGLGSLEASCNSLVHGDILDILGTKMALRTDIWGRTVITYKPHTKSRSSVGRSNLHLGLQLFKVIGSTAAIALKAVRGAVRVKAHYSFISQFIDSILNNTKPPVTAEEGLETVKFLETVCRQIK